MADQTILDEILRWKKAEVDQRKRDVTLDAGRGLAPVVVGIWDSGVDPQVFGDRMFVNADETKDGADTDGNGFVDDIQGIAYDVDGRVNSLMLHPLGDQDGKLGSVYQYVQGFSDLNANVDSKAAGAVPIPDSAPGLWETWIKR